MTKSQLKVLKEGTPINVIYKGEIYKMYFITFGGLHVVVSSTKEKKFGRTLLVKPEDIQQLSSLELELL